MEGTSERRTGSEDTEGRPLLAGQLRLIETRREDVLALRGRDARDEDLTEDLANDLAGARLVILAALLAGGLTDAERGGVERSEREATALLREVIAARRTAVQERAGTLRRPNGHDALPSPRLILRTYR